MDVARKLIILGREWGCESRWRTSRSKARRAAAECGIDDADRLRIRRDMLAR
jgi:hypothetical protein